MGRRFRWPVAWNASTTLSIARIKGGAGRLELIILKSRMPA